MNVELAGYGFDCPREQTRCARVVRVGLVQNKIPLPTTALVSEQRAALHKFAEGCIELAASAAVNIICFQEAWSK